MRRWLVLLGSSVCAALSLVAGIMLATPASKPAVVEPVILPTRIDEREARILALVVERNPSATLKDFQDFPRTLLRESDAAGIDYRVVLAVIEKESEWNPRAVSYVGAIGLMQLMPDTAAGIAKSMGWAFVPPVKSKDKNAKKMYESLGSLGDPSYNVRMGIVHLRDHIKRFGMNAIAFRAYNRGEKWAKQHRPADRYAEDIGLNVVRYLASR